MVGPLCNVQIRDEYAVLDDINLPEPGAPRPGFPAAGAAEPAVNGTSAGAEDGAVPAGAKAESRSATAKLIDAMPKVSDG